MPVVKIAAVVLAAGASARLGRPKQLEVVNGERLLDRAVRACRDAELSPVVVVLGANAGPIRRTCDLASTQVVENDRWTEGMASSLRSGVNALGTDIDAAVVMTCDMPFVDGRHLRALAELSEQTRSDVASWYEGWRGIPACFRRESFAALKQLSGDTGGRALLIDAPVVELFNGSDVDTTEELRAVRRDVARTES
jgi:CTP:molybdopterin cytidylyltransferase MocA